MSGNQRNWQPSRRAGGVAARTNGHFISPKRSWWTWYLKSLKYACLVSSKTSVSSLLRIHIFFLTATVSIFSFKRHVLNHIYNQPPPQSSPWLHFGFGLRLQDFDTVSNIYMYIFFVLSFNDNNYSITVTLTFNGVLWLNSFTPPSNYRSFKNCHIIKKIKIKSCWVFF